MALPGSGPITAAAINVELGHPGSTSLPLGGAEVRGLAGVPSGAIRMAADLYGKSAAAPGAILSAHGLSPYTGAYAWDESAGFGAKYANPVGGFGQVPSGDSTGAAFAPANDRIVLSGSFPYLFSFQWSMVGGYGTKDADPTGAGQYLSCAMSPGGSAVVAGRNAAPYLHGHAYSAGFGVKYADPVSIGSGVNALGFSASGGAVACGHLSAPYVTVLPFSGGFGTKYADPTPTGIGSSGYGAHFGQGDTVLTLASSSSPYVHAYAWSAGFGAKYANPVALPPASVGYDPTFSKTGGAVIMSHSGSPYTSAWTWSGGFGTKYANPGTAPPSNCSSTAITASGKLLTVGSSTLIAAYPWTDGGGYGTKMANPGTSLGGSSYQIAASH